MNNVVKDKKSTLVVGNNSYLSQNIEEHIGNIKRISYKDISNFDFKSECNTIINFSIQPDFHLRKLDKEEIIDYKIAQKIKDINIKFIYISSRRVYGSSFELNSYNEDALLKETDFYSQNKILAEKILKDILGDRLIIVRVPNVISKLEGNVTNKTFMSWISSQMKNEGKLMVNQNLEAQKDFITKCYFQRTLDKLIKTDFSGTINLSSGFGVTLSELLTTIVGEKNIIKAENVKKSEQFILDNSKLKSILGKDEFTKEDLLNECIEFSKNFII